MTDGKQKSTDDATTDELEGTELVEYVIDRFDGIDNREDVWEARSRDRQRYFEDHRVTLEDASEADFAVIARDLIVARTPNSEWTFAGGSTGINSAGRADPQDYYRHDETGVRKVK